MPKVSLLLPTRSRPHLVQRLFGSLLAHTGNVDDIEVVLYVDYEDFGSHDLHCNGIRIAKIIGPRASMGTYNTACLRRASGDIVILMNDDVVVRTPGWDHTIIELAGNVSDGIFLAYPNDLHMGKRMCTFAISTKKACEVMAKPYPSEYQSGFIDWHLFDVFKRLKHMGHDRIFYLEKVIFEHLHFTAGKAGPDATYLARGYYTDDWNFVALRALRRRMAERLCASIEGSPLAEFPTATNLPARPHGPWRILLHYASSFLFDFALPLDERIRLFVWLTGRYLRSISYLPPKRPLRKSDE